MNSWKIILAALVIFAAGVITGGVTVRLGSRALKEPSLPVPSADPAAAPGSVAPPVLQRMEMLRRLESTLSLSPAQRDEIDALVRDSQERVRKLWEPVRPRAQEEFRQLRDKVKAVLTPEQLTKFEELMRRRQSRRASESSRPESAPGPSR